MELIFRESKMYDENYEIKIKKKTFTHSGRIAVAELAKRIVVRVWCTPFYRIYHCNHQQCHFYHGLFLEKISQNV